MNRYLEKLERITDALIVPSLLLILIIVVLELFFTKTAHHYDTWINMADTVVISVFVVDLSFKFHRASNWEGFLKNNWLEIIAITPLFYVFRFVEALRLASTAEIGQEGAHLAEGARSSRFTSYFRSANIARAPRFGRFIRAISRAPRFAAAANFFEHPDHAQQP